MTLHASFSRYIYWPLVQKIKGEFAARALDELSRYQWKSRDELLFEQWQMVRRTVTKAVQEVPYYRETYRRLGWDSSNKNFVYEDFLNLPIVEKEDVRDRLAEFLNPHYQGRITEGRTSGSTGQSLTLYYSSEHESYSEAARWRAKEWWGIRLGSPHVTVWGRPYTGFRDRFSQKIKSYCMNTLLISAFDLHADTMVHIWKKIDRFRPLIIYGYPSAISTLAVYLKENGISASHIGVKVIIITAEFSTQLERDLIEEVFDCKTANEYGCSETGGFAYECPLGSLHVSSELTFVEFLNSDGEPIEPGETGEMIITHLRNDYMPLIRYRVGDVGLHLAENCTCGRGLPLMKIALGKERDFIRLSNGNRYTSEILVYITRAVVKKYPSSILHFRAVQKNLKLLEIEIVCGHGSVDRAESMFKELFKNQVGNEIHIIFKRVPEIKRESSGKLRYFISDLDGSR